MALPWGHVNTWEFIVLNELDALGGRLAVGFT